MPAPQGYRRLEGTERQPARGARLIGPADPNETLSVTIRVRRRADAPPLPDEEHWAATPAERRTYISRRDFAKSYGAAQADLDRVAQFARSKGLMVTESNEARRTVVVSGTVKQMSDAFAVELGHYETPTETYRGRVGHVNMPADVADIVEGVFGLDNRRMAYRNAGGSRITITTLTPLDVARFYNFPPSPPNISNQTIGILELGGGYTIDDQGKPTDINSFFQNLGLPLPSVTAVSVDGAKNTVQGSDRNVSNSDIEVALDIDVAGCIASGAPIAVYFAPGSEQGWVDSITTAIHPGAGQPAPSVLSISWAAPENSWTTAAINAMSSSFREAAAMGVTLLVASGDSGTDCNVKDGNAHVYYPPSDPWMTACGGTTIGNVMGTSFAEVAWNDTGGGISAVFPLPSWQENVGVPPSINDGRTTGRGVPDIAGYANGYTIDLYGAAFPGIAGTSETAPLYAGLVARINATLGFNVGYLNPILYALGKTNVFRDIADGGSNAFTFTRPDGTTGTSPGYTAGSGWDACTGWGRIDGNALLTALLTHLVSVERYLVLHNLDPRAGVRHVIPRGGSIRSLISS